MSVTDELTDIESAITAIEGGAQEYRTLHKTVRRADLATLYGERRRLKEEQAADAGYSIRVAVFDRR